MVSALVASFLTGLVGSPHCVGMCGPFAVACSRTGAGAAAWHAGKLGSYAVVGAVAGGFGSAIPGPGWLAAAVSAGLIVWFAAALAGLAPEPAVRLPGLSGLASRVATDERPGMRFVFGVANGLLPCGLVYAAAGLAVATGTPVAGALTMIAFGLGTVPALTAFALGTRRIVVERPWTRKALAGAVLLAGLWMVAHRAPL